MKWGKRFERHILVACLATVVTGSASLRADEGGNEAIQLRDYHSANGLLARGLHELAEAEYRRFLQQHGDHPKAPSARYGLAVCLFRTQRYEEACAELSRIAKIRDFEFAAEVQAVNGQALLALQRYAEATRSFDRLLERHPSHDLADDAAALALEATYRSGRMPDIAPRAEAFMKYWPDSPLRHRVALFWGLALKAQGRHAEATRRLQAVLDDCDDRDLIAQAALQLAQCHHHQGQVKKALKYYRKAAGMKRPDLVPEALYGQGVLLQQQGDHAEAADLLQRLVEDHPMSEWRLPAQLRLAQSWYESGELKRATAVLKDIPSEDPRHGDEVAYWLAKCTLKAGDHTRAARQLARALERFPESELRPEMHYDLAVAYLRAGKAEQGVKVLDGFVQEFPRHALAPEAQHLLAATEHQQDHHDASLKHCRAFLKEHPRHALASRVAFLAAENHYLAGDYPAAAQAFQRFMDTHPEDADLPKAKYRLGMSFYHQQDFERAQQLLQGFTNAKSDGTYRSAALVMGEIHFQRGEWKQAERHLKRYLGGDDPAPAADAAGVKLGLAQLRQGELEAALRRFDAVIDQSDSGPHRLQAIFEKGQTLVTLGRLDDAAAAFEQLLKEGSTSRFAVHALNHLGALAMRQKQYGDAADYFRHVARSADGDALPAQGMLRQAQALVAAEQLEEACEVLAAFLKKHPDHEQAPQARVHMIKALSRQQRFKEALTHIERFERTPVPAMDPQLLTDVRYEKAWVLKGLGRPENVADTYRRLLAEGGDPLIRAHALVELAELEADALKWKEAVALLAQFQELSARDDLELPASLREQGAYRLGVALFELQRYDEAAEVLEMFVKRFGESPVLASAAFFCAESHYRAARHQRALNHLKRIVEQFPEDEFAPTSLLRMGECLAALQKWDRSEEVFQRYLQRFGAHELWFQAQFGVGWARENQGRYEDAVKAYRRVVERHQGATAARAQFQIGQCLFAQKRYEPAARELLKVDILYDFPEWQAAALFEAGRCFEQLGQADRAREQFEQVTRKYQKTEWADLASQRLQNSS